MAEANETVYNGPTAEHLLSELHRKYPNHCKVCGALGVTAEKTNCPGCTDHWKDPFNVSVEFGNYEPYEWSEDIEPYWSETTGKFFVMPDGCDYRLERDDEALLLCVLATITPDKGEEWRKKYSEAHLKVILSDLDYEDDVRDLEYALRSYLEDDDEGED